MNDLQVYEAHQATAVAKRGGYEVTSPLTGNKAELKRDVDFGVVPGTKSPSLLKPGAEKICMAYGLMQHYMIETKIERYGDDGSEPFFYYLIKCELVKVSSDGSEYVFSSGHGSSNTRESRNGKASCYNSANSTLKMAEKRALVDAALHVSGLSSMFSQDMENESFMSNGYSDLEKTLQPDSPITKPQTVRMYAIGAENGHNAAEVKKIVSEMGFRSTKDITQKDYQMVCDKLEGKKE